MARKRWLDWHTPAEPPEPSLSLLPEETRVNKRRRGCTLPSEVGDKAAQEFVDKAMSEEEHPQPWLRVTIKPR